MNVAVIFGGSGFIGSYYAHLLVKEKKFTKIYLYDLEPISSKGISYRIQLVHSCPEIEEVSGDIRKPITWEPSEKVELIANFAAIHREPGHLDSEYYETNLQGADNVCAWAERVNCRKIVFTSSIAPYGAIEGEVDENSIPCPNSPYGCSKLVAEKIHQSWAERDNNSNQLLIVRPGVVFGPGERGNVSRLIKAVIGRYFIYVGNKNTRKAGIYVKELCEAITWTLKLQHSSNQNVVLANMCTNPAPSMQEYVEAVCSVSCKKRFIPSMPLFIIVFLAYLLDLISKIFGFTNIFSPVRVKKSTNSNNIKPTFLIDNGYTYKFSLNEAFEDWKKSNNEDWITKP